MGGNASQTGLARAGADPTPWQRDEGSWSRIGTFSVSQDLPPPPPQTGTEPAPAGWVPTAFALGEAQKPVVLFFYCTTAAGNSVCDCIRMRGLTFTDARLTGLSGSFDWYLFDVDAPGAAPYRERFHAPGSPVLVVLDPSGDEVWRCTGYQQPEQLAPVLRRILDGMPERRRRLERVLARLRAGLETARAALDEGRLPAALDALRDVKREARHNGYAQWAAQADEGLARLLARVEARLARIEAFEGTNAALAVEARQIARDFGGEFPEVAQRARVQAGRLAPGDGK